VQIVNFKELTKHKKQKVGFLEKRNIVAKTENFGKKCQLKQRTVVYSCWRYTWLTNSLHCPLVVLYSGSYVIDVEASPMLRNIVMNASQQTPSSDAVFDHNSAETVYDTWLLHSPSDFDNFMPRSAVNLC